MEEKIIEAAKELLIQIHEKEKMSDFEITIATETLRVLLHSVLNGLSDRDQFAIGFATSLLELDNVPLTEDGKQKLKVKFDLYKQSLTKNR